MSRRPIVLLLAVTAAVPAAPAAAARRPDLRVSKVTASVTGARAQVHNAGGRRAGASSLRLLASADARADRGDTRLGTVRVRALKAGRRRVVARAVAVPATRPLHVIACADAKRTVREAREGNNCRAAGELPAPGPAPASPLPAATATETATATAVATVTATASPVPDDPCAAPDAPDAAFADTNCDGVDGDAAGSVFVAASGDDAAAGTREAPLRSITAGLDRAEETGRDAVLVSAGTYVETIRARNGIGIHGGYAAGTWVRSQDAVVTVRAEGVKDGRLEALLASNLTATTRVDRLHLETIAGYGIGTTTYAVRAVYAPGLRVEHSVLAPGKGGTGGQGGFGAAGVSATSPGQTGDKGWCDQPVTAWGGAGAAGPLAGGDGGHGGKETAFGTTGQPGQGPHVAAGGPGGGSGDPGSVGKDGKPGADGDDGFPGFGGSGGVIDPVFGTWTSAAGNPGVDGEDGSGGGGGGGGGGQYGLSVTNGSGNGGGGGGAGGAGGAGGSGGTGGGGSFGLLAVASTGMELIDNSITAKAGGTGGAAGAGGAGGTGSKGGAGGGTCTDEVGAGGKGGDGGNGGAGGYGGGGAGGPSYGVYRYDTTLAIDGNGISAAAGGAGGYPSGKPGLVAAVK